MNKGVKEVTVGEMKGFTDRFKQILRVINPSIKRTRLVNLMQDIEKAYGIPYFYSSHYEKAYPDIMQLFRTVEDEMLSI